MKPKAIDYAGMAATLRAHALAYPLQCDETDRARFHLGGSFWVSCLASQPAIERLASRLQKGPTKYAYHRAQARQA